MDPIPFFQAGAEVVFFLLPSGIGHHTSSQLLTVRTYRGLLCNSSQEFFNGVSYFGCNTSSVMNPGHSDHCGLCDLKPPALQVAAIPGRMKCDSSAPPIAVDQDNYVRNYSLKNALYYHDAFWALPVVPVEGLDLQVWLLAVQKLLWINHNNLMLYNNQAGLSELFNSSAQDPPSGDLQLWTNIHAMLSKWQCRAKNYLWCVQDLLETLQRHGFISENSHKLLTNYLEVLSSVGYSVIVRKEPRSVCTAAAFHPVNHSSPQYYRWDKSAYTPLTNGHLIRNVISDTCKDYPIPKYVTLNFTQPWLQFEKTLLVVTFNNPHYNAIPYIESVYRAFYPLILYCGPGFPNPDKFPSLKGWTFDFVSYGSTPEGHFPGSLNYECLSMAVDFHYSVEGYQIIADDVLLALYKLRDLRSHLVWFMPQKDVRIGDVRKLRECRLGMCDFHPRWNWWESYQNEVLNALFDLEAKSRSSRTAYRCHYQLLRLTGGPLRAYRAFSDTYYIPSRTAEDFAYLAKIFRKHNVFLEITIPTIIQCLENPEDIEPLPGLLMWEENRDRPWEHFTVKEFRLNTFMHPVKWGYLDTGEPGYAEYFCTKIVPFMHDRYGRINNK